jgi:hypothetical protein
LLASPSELAAAAALWRLTQLTSGVGMHPDVLETGAVDPRTQSSRSPDVNEVIDFVTTYAKQETLGPIKGAGRWLAYGAASALTLGIGLLIVLLGVLRLIQAEWDWAASGSWSWISYLIVLVLCVGVLVLTLSRIKRDQLNKEPF